MRSTYLILRSSIIYHDIHGIDSGGGSGIIGMFNHGQSQHYVCDNAYGHFQRTQSVDRQKWKLHFNCTWCYGNVARENDGRQTRQKNHPRRSMRGEFVSMHYGSSIVSRKWRQEEVDMSDKSARSGGDIIGFWFKKVGGNIRRAAAVEAGAHHLANISPLALTAVPALILLDRSIHCVDEEGDKLRIFDFFREAIWSEAVKMKSIEETVQHHGIICSMIKEVDLNIFGVFFKQELSEALSEAVEGEGVRMVTGEGEWFMMQGAGGVGGAVAQEEEQAIVGIDRPEQWGRGTKVHKRRTRGKREWKEQGAMCEEMVGERKKEEKRVLQHLQSQAMGQAARSMVMRYSAMGSVGVVV
ncbi:hypothetical protein EDD85DRAFT_789066 [Armillaria nabsnona]|nr:hypothetical protein EDD85DRAFT_789066 [Armillaria nabsnona]